MIVERIGRPAMYEQLAEEAVELAFAALKMARILRGENPTPRTEEEMRWNIVDETTDVMICLQELMIRFDPKVEDEKRKRFRKRWKEWKAGDEQDNMEQDEGEGL